MSELREIDPALVKQLAEAYGFDYEDLMLNLTRIRQGHLNAMSWAEREPDTKEAKRHIKKILGAAKTLRQEFDGPPKSMLHNFLYAELDPAVGDEFLGTYYEPNSDNLIELLLKLEKASEEVLTIPGRPMSFRTDVMVKDAFIIYIGRLWKSYTGETPTYSTARGKRSGNFVDFMCDAADILGIDSTPLPERFSRLKRKNPSFD